MKGPFSYGMRRAAFNAAVLASFAASFAAAADSPARVAILGDSLTAGYGLPAAEAFPARLETELRGRGLAVEILNAGVSGDTTAGGLARLDWALADAPDALIVALGGNDALRGLDPAAMEANLTAIVERAQAAGAKVMLAGMRAPPNLGRDYEAAFNAVFPRVAARRGAALYPFLLDGVAADPALNQPDGIHPSAAGAAVMARRMAPAVEEWLAADP